MIAVVEAEIPPLRLPLGEVCLGMARRKLASVAQELDRWEGLSLATSYESA